MAEIINLRQARKAKARAAGESTAAANRARFGQTKGERLKQEAEAARQSRLIDGALRDEGRSEED